ncbi:kyphoscoliosis peptidase-like isoform X2 [Aquarana catesbeiana]|uniref:kyphoscoliosis peptidase-like isoform X2 n=1 Tax=Aquarana catesbeiana TaxID=8400 RepID=UPI003CCA4308
MALHQRFKPWQNVLLGILCFPLLPFYLCIYCLCFRKSKKGKDLEEGNHSSGDARSNKKKRDINERDRNDPETRKQDNNISSSFTNKGFQNNDEDIANVKCHQNAGFENDEKNRQMKRDRCEEVKDDSGLQDRKKPKVKHSGQFDYPWDRSNLKSLEIDLKDFKELDRFASEVDSKGTLEQLVKELISVSKTDLEKTRATWIWICHHIEYDVQGYKNRFAQSSNASDVFRTRKGVCAGYSSLFQHMCSLSGVQCKKVSGYAKGAGYHVGKKIAGDSDHAWNMVYLEGRWHLLDSTWGAGTANMKINKFNFSYNEFYFLTHPALFIEDHFPELGECQLLRTEVPLEIFQRSPYVYSDFYSLGMVSYQPNTGIIETVTGKVSIAIESCNDLKFLFKLNEQESPGILILLDNGMKLDVYPQQPGQHLLKIFAQKADAEKNLQLVIEYRIDCKHIDSSMRIPKCIHNPVGPNRLTEKAGLVKPSHPDPVIYTDDGFFTIHFTLKKKLQFFCTLQSDEVQMTSEMENRHVFTTEEENKVDIYVCLPQAGTYVLMVFIKTDKNDNGNYTYLCNYLIICTNPAVGWPVFPLTYSNWAKHYKLVQPLEGILPANTDVSFKLYIPDAAAVCFHGQKDSPLALSDSNYWEGTCSTADRQDIIVMIKNVSEPNTWYYLIKYEVKTNKTK